MTLLIGAFLSGCLAALVMPFLAFAFVLFVTIVAGSIVVGLRDAASFHIIISAFVLLVSGQLGFGIALLARALVATVGRRRLTGSETSVVDEQPLLSEERDQAM